LLVIEINVLQQAFKTTSLTPFEWAGVFIAAFFVLAIVEAWKAFIRGTS